jgi:hypothetical protein
MEEIEDSQNNLVATNTPPESELEVEGYDDGYVTEDDEE